MSRKCIVDLRRDEVIQKNLGLSRRNWKYLRKNVSLRGGESRDAKQDEPARLEKGSELAVRNDQRGQAVTLQQFAASVAANIPELPHLEQSCLQFVSMVGSLQEVSKQQAALVADKQEASKQFRTLLIECQRLASILRAAIKQHYGIRSEKLAEYNLQPFRGRKSKKTQPESVPVQPQPESPEAQ